MPELRRDRLTGEVVLLAPGRADRPHPPLPRGATGDRAQCPFCPGHEASTPPEVARVGDGPPDGPGWRLRVVPNLYPIVGGPDAGEHATGAHEVVVLSPDHDRDLSRLSDDATVDAFALLRDRARVHRHDGHAFVQAVVNQGVAAGASLAHPHAQVVALDFVPPAAETALARFAASGRDLVAADRAGAVDDGTVVLERGSAAAWCAAASSSPFELRVAALDAGPRFADGADDDVAAVGLAVRDGLRRLGAVLDDPPYNVVVYDAPARGDDPYHWWVRVVARTAVPAGFELGTGVLVQTVDPGRAAERLRAASSW